MHHVDVLLEAKKGRGIFLELELHRWLLATMFYGYWEWNPRSSVKATSALNCLAITPVPPLEHLGQKELNIRNTGLTQK